MSKTQRREFFRRHVVGLIPLLVIYILLTVVRSIRDDFAVEVWQGLGVDDEPSVFARSEFWVMIGVTVVNGMVILIRNNRIAFLTGLGTLMLGFAIVLMAIAGQAKGLLSPMAFMVMLGLGMYIPYVAFHTTVFERMIAAFKEVGTIGYLMYLADAVGYLGYVAVMIFRNTFTGQVNFLGLLQWTSVIVAAVSTAATVFLIIYYTPRIPQDEDSPR